MKKLDIQKLIKEELQNVLKEAAASKAQQQAAGIALSVKRGDAPVSKLKDAGKAMSKMSEKELEKIAGTKTKDLPKKVKKEEVSLSEDAQYFPVRMIKHLQRAILAALKDGTIRIAGKSKYPVDVKDYPGYAEDIAIEMIKGKALRDIIENL